MGDWSTANAVVGKRQSLLQAEGGIFDYFGSICTLFLFVLDYGVDLLLSHFIAVIE